MSTINMNSLWITRGQGMYKGLQAACLVASSFTAHILYSVIIGSEYFDFAEINAVEA